MTAITLPNTGLKSGYTDAEIGWGVQMNRNLRVLDALVQPRIVDKDLTAPPGSPTNGQVYIVGAGATGAWSGHDTHLAIWMTGDDLTSAWTYVVPLTGWLVFVVDEFAHYQYDGGDWLLVAFTYGGDPYMTPPAVVPVTASTHNIVDPDEGTYLRFTATGAKTVTFRPDSVEPLAPDTEYTLANRAASGDLTIIFTSPAVGAVPAGGTLVLAPGMTVTVKRAASDAFDVIGQTVAA